MLTITDPSAGYNLFAGGRSYLQFVKSVKSAKRCEAKGRKRGLPVYQKTGDDKPGKRLKKLYLNISIGSL